MLTNCPLPQDGTTSVTWRGLAGFVTSMPYQSSFSAPGPIFWTVSTKAVKPTSRKPMPPEVMTLSAAVTVLSSVVPSLSYSRAVSAPPAPHVTCTRYQWLACHAWLTGAPTVTKPKPVLSWNRNCPVSPATTTESAPAELAPKPSEARPWLGVPSICTQ